jgi:hypothetical protein
LATLAEPAAMAGCAARAVLLAIPLAAASVSERAGAGSAASGTGGLHMLARISETALSSEGLCESTVAQTSAGALSGGSLSCQRQIVLQAAPSIGQLGQSAVWAVLVLTSHICLVFLHGRGPALVGVEGALQSVAEVVGGRRRVGCRWCEDGQSTGRETRLHPRG